MVCLKQWKDFPKPLGGFCGRHKKNPAGGREAANGGTVSSDRLHGEARHNASYSLRPMNSMM